MPEMDGFEATTLLRESEKFTGNHQPVVAMTAMAMIGDRDRCIAAGMDGYLSKPIRPQELDAVLDEYMDRKSHSTAAGGAIEVSEAAINVSQLMERIDSDLGIPGRAGRAFRRRLSAESESSSECHYS